MSTLQVRWNFFERETFITLIAMTMVPIFSNASVEASQQLLFIGTHTESDGIYACNLNHETGALSPVRLVAKAPRPGFLALHPNRPMLYAITREKNDPNGGVRAFRIMDEEGALRPIGQQSTGDNGATHLAIDHEGKSLMIVHYEGGSTALLPLANDGSIGPLALLVEHVGSSVAPPQTGPHAHGIAWNDDGRFACVADLGTDEVIVYRLGQQPPLQRVATWKAAPGAGPRHLSFHPNAKWLYCINELDSTLSILDFDAATGALTLRQTVDTLPAGFEERSTTAEIVVHPSGNFVYGSNRGHDSTAVFTVDSSSGSSSGMLTLVETEPTGGVHPRSIAIEPTGRFLVTANRDSNNLVSFRINETTGALQPTGYKTEVPKPVCVVFPTISGKR